jgi:uncharacterized protein YjbI with pentapeptide repeats
MAEPDTKELDALLASLNGSAERFQTLWFSFLGLTLYLAITALTTTHRMLLLGEPQTLPILNMKVELLPFYVIAPLFYVVFHFYLLMMLLLLARTAAPFDKQLRMKLRGGVYQERYRARVENSLFLQMLVGMKQERAGFNSILLASIALITIVVAPTATLILMQMMFLPYHSFAITWWHRVLVFADLGVVLIMWRSFFYDSDTEDPLLLFRNQPKLRGGLVFTANLGAFAVAFWLSLWEGRWAGENIIGRADFGVGILFPLFADRLNLENEIIVGKSRFEEIKNEIASRGGEFVPTRDFNNRDLQAAVLSGADLRGVSLLRAVMCGANLTNTRLDGADLSAARLMGADLSGAGLRGAELLTAKLQGAELFDAKLQGARLAGAQLQGADLTLAELQGADLRGAANLQGADLQQAQLQGADLNNALMQGARLAGTWLDGADLEDAELADSEFKTPLVYRTDMNSAKDVVLSRIHSARSDPTKPINKFLPIFSAWTPSDFEPLTPVDIAKWTSAATEFARETNKNEIDRRFARLKPDFQADTADRADEAKWSEWEKDSRALDSDGAKHRGRLATLLGNLVCGADGSPYVGRAFVSRYLGDRLARLGDQFDKLRDRVEASRANPEKCPGVARFTDDDWQNLRGINPIRDNE